MQSLQTLDHHINPTLLDMTGSEGAMTNLNFKPYKFKALRTGAVKHPDWTAWSAQNNVNSATATKADLVRFHLETFSGMPLSFEDWMRYALVEEAKEAAQETVETVDTTPEAKPEATEALNLSLKPPTPKATTKATPDAAQALAKALSDMMAGHAPQASIDPAQIEAIVKAETSKAMDAAANALFLVNAALDEVRAEAAKTRVTITIIDQAKQTTKKLEGLYHKDFQTLLACVSAKKVDGSHNNVWLYGPAGSGKTHAAAQVAKALDLPFGFHGSMSQPHELVGFVDAAGKYQTTQFVKRFIEGGLILLDEIDAGDASVLLTLNAALDNGMMSLPNGEIVNRHPNFVCIAAANTTGLGGTADYVGRTKIDQATLTRFPIKIEWSYDEDLEQAFSGHVQFAIEVQKARAKAKKLGIKTLITPRHAAAGAALIAAGVPRVQIASLTYLSGMTTEQASMMMKG